MYYSALKYRKLPHIAAWMNHDIMQNEISQAQKTILCAFTYIRYVE